MPERPRKDPVRAARRAQNELRKALLARADAIAGLFPGMVLIQADQALDQARRLFFACYFDGRTLEDQADGLGCDAMARKIAAGLDGLTPAQAVQVLERVRWGCWQARYQGCPAAARAGAVH